MSTVHQRALQSIKAFRNAHLHRPPCKPTAGTKPLKTDLLRTNPFLPTKVRGPKSPTKSAQISLRRQADLAKQARLTNTLHLLPPGPKTSTLEMRMQRVKQSLTPELAKVLDEANRAESPVDILTSELKQLKVSSVQPLEKVSKELLSLKSRAQELQDAITEFEVVSLIDTVKDSPELHSYNRKKETLKSIQLQISNHENKIEASKNRLLGLEKRINKEKKKATDPQVLNPAWQKEIKWNAGSARVKTTTKGEELGIRLYAGKKRMFKGHLWERQRAGVVKKRAILMRDMAARVQRYKEYYKKRKPNPLKPSRYSKPPKLPF